MRLGIEALSVQHLLKRSKKEASNSHTSAFLSVSASIGRTLPLAELGQSIPGARWFGVLEVDLKLIVVVKIQ